MCIHRVLTITLISYSWMVNLIRLGSLFIFIHNTAEILFEMAKIFKCGKYDTISSALFATLGYLWIATRLRVFFKIIYLGIFDTLNVSLLYPFYYFLAIICLLLLVVHGLYTLMIFISSKKYINIEIIED